MAKSSSSKTTFKDTVSTYERLVKEISGGKYAPVYLLMGEEGYFIDGISELIGNSVLTEAERAFNQITVYGKDTDEGTIINYARQMPMMGRYEVIIVREAQTLRKPEQLSLYTASPSPSTILVICYKGKSIDKRSQLYKHVSQKGEVLESVRPRDYEITSWLGGFIQSKGCTIDTKALNMLTDHLGTDIAKISNELSKLLTRLPEDTKTITAQHIEDNIGISKDFNNFELTKAVSEKNIARALLIADHFKRNPKDNPLTVTLSALFTHFQRIFIVNYKRWQVKHKGVAMPSDTELSTLLKLPNPFFLNEYKQAANIYPNKKVFNILGLLREYDMRSKGIGNGSSDDGELLRELLLKIFMA